MLQQVSAHPEGLRRQSWLGPKSRGPGVHHGEPGAGWSCGNGSLAVQPWVAQETSSPGMEVVNYVRIEIYSTVA